MSASVTGVKSPPLSGVTASLTSAGFGWFPSTTYTGFTSEPLTFTVTGISEVYVVPSGDVNVTGTFTTTGSPFLLAISAGSSGISPTVTVYPSGTFVGKSGVLINSFALFFRVSLTLSGVAPLGTSTSPSVLGRTVTGTVTSSVTSVPSTSWVTVVGIVNPVCPAFPSVLKISVAFGSLAVPLFPSIVTGSTFSLTFAGVISSPSNTTTGFVLDSLAVPLPTVVAGSTFSLTLAGVILSPSNTTIGFVLDSTTFTSISTVVS